MTNRLAGEAAQNARTRRHPSGLWLVSQYTTTMISPNTLNRRKQTQQSGEHQEIGRCSRGILWMLFGVDNISDQDRTCTKKSTLDAAEDSSFLDSSTTKATYDYGRDTAKEQRLERTVWSSV
jgi:hypothetical protein